MKVYRYTKVFFNSRVLAFFKKSDLKETRTLFFISRIIMQC